MKILLVIKKEIKHLLRDTQGMIMMVVFPLVLTLVLGLCLSGMYQEDTGPSSVSALYTADMTSPLGNAFVAFAAEVKDNNIFLTQENDIEAGKAAVKKGETSCYIQVSGGRIQIFTREGSSFDAELMTSILKGFTQTYDAIMVTQTAPAATNTGYLNNVSLDRNRQPGAMDYYAVTMMTLIIMYSALSGISSITAEKRNKTLSRLLCAPIGNSQILVPKVVGLVLGTTAQIILVFLFDKFILNAEWGSNLLPVFAVLFSQIVMMISVGVGFAYLFKNSNSAATIISTLIPFMVFLGGGYISLDVIGLTGIIKDLTYISPIRWINSTLFSIIYANDFSTFGATIAICLAIAVLFLGASAILSKKELKV
jgi:ABC-2 type transport system permease protein